MKLGFIGLGKMGSRMVIKLLQDNHQVIVWNRSEEPVIQLQKKIKSSHFTKASRDRQNLKISKSIKDLVNQLSKPRVVWMMLPAGEVTEVMLNEVSKYVQKGDIIIDGANSNFKDTERRYQSFTKKGIRYLGIGVSGGVIAARDGYPLMAGGTKSAYDYIKPILSSLAKPFGGCQYFGNGGAGHFVKMVHNGIEYPIMQAIGEGFGILANSSYNFDLLKIAKLYQKGTLVSGFMMERTIEALENDPKLSHIAGIIGSASGEAIWTVQEAKKLKQPVESVEQAISFRKRSETEKSIQNSFAAKMIGALRIAFGGHEVKKK